MQGGSRTGVFFLGTGCSEPSAWRGGSAILLRVEENSMSLMIDAGEGTYGQLIRYFGEEEARKLVGAVTHKGTKGCWFHFPDYKSIPYSAAMMCLGLNIGQQPWLHLDLTSTWRPLPGPIQVDTGKISALSPSSCSRTPEGHSASSICTNSFLTECYFTGHQGSN